MTLKDGFQNTNKVTIEVNITCEVEEEVTDSSFEGVTILPEYEEDPDLKPP